jgi:crotonobetainyl-CoA:carnitine CoA-transferase CaiB-like acyl-CoA transferase
MRTANGYLMIAAAGGPILLRCAEALGHKEWCDAGRFVTNRQRLQNREALEAQWRRC